MMSLDQAYLEKLRVACAHLESHGVVFEPGLSDEEVSRAEEKYTFTFPPDMRWFLQRALPVGKRYPNWRKLDDVLLFQIDGPSDGICFDIKNNVFWWPEWGQRPDIQEEAFEIARKHVAEAPFLIPIFGHSYLPSEPLLAGNPVFSVSQTDVIHRGGDLAEYLLWLYVDKDLNETYEDNYPVFSEEYRHIRFWSELTKWNVRS